MSRNEPPAVPKTMAPAGQLSEGQARMLSPDQVVAELAAGRLDYFMGRVPGVPAVASEQPATGSDEV